MPWRLFPESIMWVVSSLVFKPNMVKKHLFSWEKNRNFL
jgi:hypothetical protein